MKTSELTGAQLDYWVAKAEGHKGTIAGPRFLVHERSDGLCVGTPGGGWHFAPSTEWKHGGPIIEREQMTITSPSSRVHRNGGPNAGWGPSGIWGACTWRAGADGRRSIAHHETSPLIAAMRAYVASRFGDEVSESPQ